MIAPHLLAALVQTPSLPGPTGPPVSPYLDEYGSKYYVHWTNGDTSAQTRVYRDTSTLVDTVNPGETISGGYSTADGGDYSVAHYKNGQETAKIDAALP